MGLTSSGSFWSRLRFGASVGAIVAGSLLAGTGAQAKQVTPAATSQASTISAGITIQNLDNTSGSATVTYYNNDGTVAGTAQTVSLTPLGNTNIFPIGAPAGFAGSAVVTSENDVNAVVNLLQSNPTAGEAYDGISSAIAANTAFVPGFQQNNGGFNTNLTIQNACNCANTVTTTFIQNGASSTPIVQALAAYGSITYNSANDNLGSGKFVGSATISGTQNVAVETNITNGTEIFSTSTNEPSGTTLYAPLLMTNNGGYSTGFSVQNASGTATTITLTPSGNQSLPATVVSLAAGASVSWYPIPGTTVTGPKFLGSAIVTSNPPVPLLGSVNQLSTSTGQASAYSAFTSGTQTVNFPLAMFNNGGYYTGENVQNIGTVATLVDVLVNGVVVPGQSQTIQPGGSFNWFNASTNTLLGSAKTGAVQLHAESAGAQIVGVANEVTVPQQSGDTFFAYEGFNQ